MNNERQIVVNRCYGGFELSQKAILALVKKESTAIKKYLFVEYFGNRDIPDFKSEKFKCVDGYYYEKFMPHVLFDDKYVYHLKDLNNHERIREHEDVVNIVKELGDEANGQCAKLKIVSIPMDVLDYEIDEYDGIETIHEKHRSW